MRLKGKVYKDGKFWLVEIPCLEAITQGMSKKEAFTMIKEYLELQIESYLSQSVSISVFPLNSNEFEVEASDSNVLFAFLLRMSRSNSKRTIESVKEELGFKSINSYQAYEYGKREPSLSKMESLLKSVNPNARLVVEI